MARDGGVGRLWLVLLASALLALPMPARGADAKAIAEARAYHERATAAFALGHFAKAAEYFEQAFELSPDPAELFNAAQAHRLANENERALLLYRNYLRVFPRGEKRSEVEARVEELKQAIAREGKPVPPVTAPPPTSPPPSSSEFRAVPDIEAPAASPAPSAPPPTPGPAPKAEVAPVSRPPAELPVRAPPPAPAPAPPSMASLATTAPAPASAPAPRGSHVIWWVLGAVVVVAAGAGLALALSTKKDPQPTLGVFP